LLVKIVQNCHNEIYQRCVLDDGDPNVDALPILTRQLSLLDDDPTYQQHWFNCEYGWHGTLTVHETLNAPSQRARNSSNGGTLTITQDTSGNRDFMVELANKKEQATGHAEGKVLETTRSVTSVPNCTLTTVAESAKATTGTGISSLRKVTSDKGNLVITFSGPPENTTQGQTGKTDSSCGAGGGTMPAMEMPLPSAPWRGTVTSMLSDPFAESISGSKTLVYVVNAAGVPVTGRIGEAGGAIRVPAIPGAGAVAAVVGEQIIPWLSTMPTGAGEGDQPSSTFELTWELLFGEVH
jgi:hypothetical protein